MNIFFHFLLKTKKNDVNPLYNFFLNMMQKKKVVSKSVHLNQNSDAVHKWMFLEITASFSGILGFSINTKLDVKTQTRNTNRITELTCKRLGSTFWYTILYWNNTSFLTSHISTLCNNKSWYFRVRLLRIN